MPISPEWNWSETEGGLEVVVQLVKGASKSKADVFATDAMLKVNSPPYLLILDLCGLVDDDQSVVTIQPDGVTFRLVKAEKCRGIWGQLEPQGVSREEAAVRRNASIDRAHAKLEAQGRERLERKQREGREATERSIESDRRRRQALDDAKRRELEGERADLAEWQKKIGNQDAESDYEDEDEAEGGAAGASTSGQQSQQAMSDHPDYHGRGYTRGGSGGAGRKPSGAGGGGKSDGGAGAPDQGARGVGGASRALLDLEDDDEDGDAGTRKWEDSGSEDKAPRAPQQQQQQLASFKPLPPPRVRLEPVRVEFTKLETGHLPAREGREEEIKLHKKQQYEAAGINPGDSVDVADRQPVFLKDKGDALYRQGNYRGAINAYARAVEIDRDNNPHAPALWANSAACFLQLGEHEHCVGASSKALELLRSKEKRVDCLSGDEADALRRALMKSLARRGQARAALGRLEEAEQDYVDALRYDAANASLAADLAEVRASMAPADTGALRARGAARFQAKDYDGAVHAFSLLLAMPHAAVPESERLAALSNRAAALLVLERYGAAAADCTAALALHARAVWSAVRSAAAVQSVAAVQSAAAVQTGDSGGAQNSADADADAAAASPWKLHALVAGLGAWPLDGARAGAAARVAARRGAAAAHLKVFADSALDYDSASTLARWSGDGAWAEQLAGDAERCRGLLTGGGGGAVEGGAPSS
ncbi:hypothetical protein FOA52_003455 [Chlamydomonas sp. UWO 241]|nr:hypothetical protein FOA52_003455 [Chlamydomonas sp. UWO 241]